MKTNSVINLVGVRCRPELEGKFRKWLSEVHVPMLLKFQGLRSVTQCQITKPDEKYPSFMTIYEFKDREAFEAYEHSPELAAARKEGEGTWKEGDIEIMWRVQYEVLRQWSQI